MGEVTLIRRIHQWEGIRSAKVEMLVDYKGRVLGNVSDFVRSSGMMGV